MNARSFIYGARGGESVVVVNFISGRKAAWAEAFASFFVRQKWENEFPKAIRLPMQYSIKKPVFNGFIRGRKYSLIEMLEGNL